MAQTGPVDEHQSPDGRMMEVHVWRRDHNGFTRQDPDFVDVVVNKKADVVRVHFPSDANCLLSVVGHCLWSQDGTVRIWRS